jgi:hypothetical protein
LFLLQTFPRVGSCGRLLTSACKDFRHSNQGERVLP